MRTKNYRIFTIDLEQPGRVYLPERGLLRATLSFWVFFWGCASSQRLPSLPEIATKVGPAVVQILIPDAKHHDLSQRSPSVRVGSGVIFDSAGHILTNHHIIEGAEEALILLSDGRRFLGKLVGTDSVSDLAVVAINAPDLPFATLGDSSRLRVGETVIAIGNSMGLDSGPTVGTGVVSALNVWFEEGPKFGLTDLIQTDAAINEGNSGGALVNAAGAVIGINIAMTPSVYGIGVAVASDRAKAIASEILRKGKITRPRLGIIGLSITRAFAVVYKLSAEAGIFVSGVQEKSLAMEAGLQAGDIIVAMDGNKILNVAALLFLLGKKLPGETADLTINRHSNPVTVRLTLPALPDG